MADETETAAAPSLRDSLAAGLAEAQESSQAEPPAATAVADTRTRDEAGRFAKEEKERQETAQVAKPLEGAPEIKPVGWDQRGLSWKKEYWGRFEKLEPELQQYILQRENEYKAGVSTYKGEAEAAKALKTAIEPFLPELQRHNIDPSAWIRNLGNAHQTLALGSPQAKLQIFQRLAQDYGVPLQYLVPNQQGQIAQLDPAVQYLAQNLQGLQQQWQQFQSQQQAAEQASIQQSIEQFKTDATRHPHFEAVREQMAALLSANLAQNLDEAYEKAIWMSPQVREQVVAASQQRATQTKLEQQKAITAKAKAQAVSPRSSTPGAQANATAKKSLRDTLSEAFGDASSRV